ncbi:MAG: CRISPR-associated endonuclease Cas1 [Promethearchaeota archaeon]|nr:MAG: CRISPR-associated endonuclease Cas1 [Candidatus Lokiarchaeota archaeon]
MAYVFETPGMYLGKHYKMIVAKSPDGEKREIAVKNMDLVVINSRVQISHDALVLLARNAIPVVLSVLGKPVGVFHPFASHGSVMVRRQQILAAEDGRGVYLAKSFVKAGLTNKVRLLSQYARTRKESDLRLSKAIQQKVDEIKEKIDAIEKLDKDDESIKYKIMGHEGDGTKAYFEAIKLILPASIRFSGRNRRPPSDPVNSSLSYGYAILYGKMMLGIAAAGLEPFAGFLHSDRSGKPALVLDVIEEFRQAVVDRVVFKCFTKRMLKITDFDVSGDRCLFTDSGKKRYIEEFFKNYDDGLKINEREYSFQRLIIKQCRKLARYLLKKSPTYEPFLLPW